MKKFSLFVENRPHLSNNQKASFYDKSIKSNIPISVLEEVYRRGIVMFNEETSNITKEQYAFDRVNSFIAGGFAYELDKDLVEGMNVRTMSLNDIANKHKVSIDSIKSQFEKGSKVEKEHTKDTKKAGEIARDHLGEIPNYYSKLKKVEKSPVKESEIDKNAFKAGREATNKELSKYPFKSRYMLPPVDVPKKTTTEQVEKHSSDKNKPSSRFVGSSELTKVYKNDTPGEVKEATFQGKQVPLNKPMKGDVKKSKVYVDPDGDGKAQKVNFGDKNLSIKKDQPARKKSYCARSGGIKGKRDVTSANYWSRKAWDCSEEIGDEELSLQDIAQRRKEADSTKTKDVFNRLRYNMPRGLIDLRNRKPVQ